MPVDFRGILVFFIVLGLFTSNMKAQEDVPKLNFVNIKEGISKVGVYSILQDDYGFIWIGTNGSGLYRFDGIDYKSYKHIINDSTSISSSQINCSYLDSRNRLWVGTEVGLNLYDRDKDQFRRIPVLSAGLQNGPTMSISALKEDDEGNLLIGSFRLGLFKMNLDNFEVENVGVNKLDVADPLVVRAIQTDSNGKIYVGTNMGLYTVDGKTGILKRLGIWKQGQLEAIEVPIRSLLIDGSDNIWVGTLYDGLYKVKIANPELGQPSVMERYSFSTHPFFTLMSLPDGTLMCGTENDGLFHISKDGAVLNHYLTNKKDEKSLLSNSIWTLYLDNDEKIWLGYYNKGVAVYDRLYDKFKDIESLYNNPNSLQISSVTSITKDPSGKLWIGMDGGGIDILDLKNNDYTHINKASNNAYKGLASDYIQTIFLDSKGNIWAGSWEGGIYFLKKGANKFINYNTNNTQGGLTSNSAMSFDEDADGTIWIGTYHSGLHSFDPDTGLFKHYNTEPFNDLGVSGSSAYKVLVDFEDNIWLGTTQGLYKINKLPGQKFSVVSMIDRMSQESTNNSASNYILSIYESSDHSIWIGTKGAGLCRYLPNTDRFIWYDKFNGLEEENVCGIIESMDGNIWLGGNAGISKLDMETMEFHNYTTDDGLLANDFNINSAFRDDQGNIYFGSYQGVNYFNPSEIITNTNETSLYLSEFRLFNEKVLPTKENSPLKKVISETDSIVLKHDQSVFTIEYSGINFTRPEKNEYAYFLEGYEESWNYVGKKRSATYTNLDPGSYTFKLKAANNDGVWNQSPLTLSITVLSPWWKTSWALFSYIALFILGIYLLNKMTQSRIREKQIIHSEREKRLQEKDLDEKKFQFFTNISHEFRTPLTLIINPLKDILNDDSLSLPHRIKEKHNIIYKNTDRLYRLVNELLDFRKLELNKIGVRAKEIDLGNLTQEVVSHFKEEALEKNIHLSLDSDSEDLNIWADESMMEKIIFNLLSNAFKVTPEGGAITIELLSKDELYNLPLVDKSKPTVGVELIISDTGPGLKQEETERIFERFYQVENLNKTYYGGTGIGLEVVQSFVELHKGKIEVKSEAGSGTSFRIILPKGPQHFAENEIFTDVKEPDSQKERVNLLKSKMEDISDIGPEEATTSYTLLIVEDNGELRSYLRNELKNQYRILLAKNGKEGLELAKSALPDIIITDVIMPEMDGFEFCKKIKGDMRTSHIPLLMLTAKARIDDRMEGIETGADAYMVKPFDLRLLRLRLSQLITSRQLIFNKYFSVISDVPVNKNTTSLDKDFIEKVLNYINNNIDDPDLSVEVLATNLNLSRSQFYRKIKALTNQTANEFLRNIRIERAKQIIEMGNTNISEVCYQVGFSSPSYFTKCFKAHFGILPTEVDPIKS
ncbi:hybrid sensor histidine kinase/response regulator transcription factor [Arenibacter palladensis]|uniref:hybrid sensor histidine kinase/response regulator transcription factor n=1 Tax=Arenibacter palladensis TaxID=237373 RepID=UPI0026E16C39|nr:hybrid sensor histidine kinase/response regulator transcription factor [Arenibacter palladensis]MDO6603035.1 two-component regulator propeller domain-containing protein [Arenibacter palladensis]